MQFASVRVDLHGRFYYNRFHELGKAGKSSRMRIPLSTKSTIHEWVSFISVLLLEVERESASQGLFV
jgi:hypothetical protein